MAVDVQRIELRRSFLIHEARLSQLIDDGFQLLVPARQHIAPTAGKASDPSRCWQGHHRWQHREIGARRNAHVDDGSVEKIQRRRSSRADLGSCVLGRALVLHEPTIRFFVRQQLILWWYLLLHADECANTGLDDNPFLPQGMRFTFRIVVAGGSGSPANLRLGGRPRPEMAPCPALCVDTGPSSVAQAQPSSPKAKSSAAPSEWPHPRERGAEEAEIQQQQPPRTHYAHAVSSDSTSCD